MSAAQPIDKPRRRYRRSDSRIWSLDGLVMPRAWMHGPRWRSAFAVREVPIAEIDPRAALLHRPGKKLLVFSFEDDVRERVLEELRPGVFAQWSDLRERITAWAC